MSHPSHNEWLRTFLHINRNHLNTFQRSALWLAISEDDTRNMKSAAELVSKKAAALADLQWHPEPPSTDMIHSPDHYATMPYEPIYFIGELERLGEPLPWCLANFLKYICRYRKKNGIEDLSKAVRYLQMEIKLLNNDPDWST